MYKILSIFLFFFIAPHCLKAQTLPKEGDSLNYRLIGFSFPTRLQASEYKIEIAAGNYQSEDSFKKSIILSLNSKTDRLIAEVPSFGRKYTWRTVYAGNDTKPVNSALHHFSTAILPEVDTNTLRLRITTPAKKYKDDFVFLDGNKALYDMAGHPVWYMPDIEGVKSAQSVFADLKATPQGTITFMNESGRPFEVNYSGAVLWQGPVDPNTNQPVHGHHEFTRLSNGHYMVLGFEAAYLAPLPPSTIDSDIVINAGDKTKPIPAGYRKDDFGTLMEYDEKGNVVWSWETAKYVIGSDLYYRTRVREKHRYDVHENSFYFDEKDQAVYVSLRNISRVIKIQYPSGAVLANYGEIYKPGKAAEGNGLFCGQHSCRISQQGYLYLYDNNSCNDDGPMPKIVMMKEPQTKKGHLKKVWEYECTIEDPRLKNKPDFGVTTGGNVLEMPGHELFVSMSTQYSKLFIVNRDKKILWSALPEKQDKLKQWNVEPQYRASIITREELEKIIWNGETTN